MVPTTNLPLFQALPALPSAVIGPGVSDVELFPAFRGGVSFCPSSTDKAMSLLIFKIWSLDKGLRAKGNIALFRARLEDSDKVVRSTSL